MKTNAVRAFRDKLRRQEPVYGLWVTLESPSITEMAVGLGLDWVVLDAEHGHLDWKELVEHLRATIRLIPSLVGAHNNLGIALASQGKLDEAIDHFQEALALDPDSAETRHNLSIAAKARGY